LAKSGATGNRSGKTSVVLQKISGDNSMPRKTEEAKAQEILKKRDDARKGLKEGMKDPEERREEKREKVGDAGLALDLGLKR
jgi:hypothetical protein